jgi:predicted NAD/FAD-binding protein
MLYPHHDITVFESGAYAGGHTNTVDVTIGDETVAVDTGFIVHNDRNYPLFVALMNELGVATQDSEMSFSMSCEISGLEYCGSSLNTVFAQRRNIARPRFIGMLREILRFNKLSDRLLAASDDQNLAEFLAEHDFNGAIADDYLIPMAAAIWSSDPTEILDFPAAYFGHFFHNHGLLSISNRPQWKTIPGGCRNYIAPLSAPFKENVLLNAPVTRVERDANGVDIVTADSHRARFDAVVFACHSDQALGMLAQPTQAEADVLGAIPYQRNETVLHTDIGLMPRKRRAWASWNYRRFDHHSRQVSVTYDMTHLQHLQASERLLVTLNATDKINPNRVLRRIDYQHPVYNRHSVVARGRWQEISGVNRSYYCGAYWGYGFHEDGMRSAVAVAEQLDLPRRAAA